MYGYEELASYTSGDIRCNDSILGLRFYEAKNTDKVIHAYEDRIKELEADAELNQKKRLTLCNGYNKKCERVKELEAENERLKEELKEKK